MPASATVSFLIRLNDLDVGIEVGLHNLTEDVTALHSGLTDATNLIGSADTIAGEAQPVAEAASTIPVPALSGLKQVSQVLKTAHKVLKDEVLPVLRDVATIVGVIVGVLVVVAAPAPLRVQAKKSRTQLLAEAASVTEQIEAKYGRTLPKELSGIVQRIESAVERVRSQVDEKTLAQLEMLHRDLQQFDPLTKALNAFQPILKTVHDVEGFLRSAVSAGSRFLAPLRKAINAFNQYGRSAMSRIEQELKKAGIDVSFVGDLEKKLQQIETQVIERLLSPIKALERTFEDHIKKMIDPLKAIVREYRQIKGKIEEQLSPVDNLLTAYINEAAQHGIHPK